MAKRVFDLLVSGSLLCLLLPILLLVAVAVWLSIGRPVFFVQERPGLNGIPFLLTKFRTMRAPARPAEGAGDQASDEQRLTPFGRWLRSWSIDELPELWNVLKGDMSLVGPRPLLMEYLPLYNAQQARRHQVKPGLTGWAQVNGRNELDWPERFELDVWYVDNQSFLLDMTILIRTVFSVFKREGIAAEGSATMPKFKGNGQ